MNTKFDVGQRVTYPVVHTADGNVTGIAVSKAGVTRYAIGTKWYAEDDLKPAAEKKPVTEPAESKPEPVKLYCLKSYSNWLTKGKVYEVTHRLDGRDCLKYDSWESLFECFDWLTYQSRNPFIASCLVPLVRRPAKVGEWVYVTDVSYTTCNDRKPGDIFLIDGDNERAESNENGFIWGSWLYTHGTGSDGGHYLVLDGYTGDPV